MKLVPPAVPHHAAIELASHVRPARASDLTNVTALTSAAYADYATQMGADLWAPYSAGLRATPDTMDATVVAELDGEVVGAVRYHRPASDRLGLPPEASMVGALAVLPAHQGRGIARRLMEECQRRAVTDGAATLMLHTAPFMERAVELYLRLGFTRSPMYDVRADEVFSLPNPSGLVAHAYALPLADDAVEVAS